MYSTRKSSPLMTPQNCQIQCSKPQKGNARQFPCESRWHTAGGGKKKKRKRLCLAYSVTVQLLSCQFFSTHLCLWFKNKFLFGCNPSQPKYHIIVHTQNDSAQCNHQESQKKKKKKRKTPLKYISCRNYRLPLPPFTGEASSKLD